MPVEEIEAKSLLRKQKYIDSWFLSRFGMNIYRGCLHDCAYCDGRAERYHVEGEFGRDVRAKVNAPTLLRRELNPSRRRKPLPRAYLCLGGGVGDAYQAVEAELGLTRGVLEVIAELGQPLHVLTKSTLVERDIDIITKIARAARAIVSVSFSTVSDRLGRALEPGCPLPSERLAVLERFRAAGVSTTMFLLPVVPEVTDGADWLDAALRAAKAAKVDAVFFGGMTMKGGRQRRHFDAVMRERFPRSVGRYGHLYTDSKWGMAHREYYGAIESTFQRLAHRHGVATRPPASRYVGLLSDRDRVTVELEGIAYFIRAAGRQSQLMYIARAVAGLPDSATKDELIERATARRGAPRWLAEVIDEIVVEGTSALYGRAFPQGNAR